LLIFLSETKKIPIVWPVPIETIRSFVFWCLLNEKLKPNTVKSYLSSIRFAHELKNSNPAPFEKDLIIKMALTGAENLNLYHVDNKPVRRSIDINAIYVIGHRISNLDWSKESKQLVWTVSLLAFFSGARMGELLPSCQNYDPFATLCWSNVKFLDNGEIVIFLPSTKTNSSKGEFVDIFPFSDQFCCPVAAFKIWKNLNLQNIMLNKPVFCFKNGNTFTPKKMNEFLGVILKDLCGPNDKISCHSFKSAVPTVLSNYPDKSSLEEIKDWGRWKSDSAKLYMKKESDKRRYLFEKISNILIESTL